MSEPYSPPPPTAPPNTLAGLRLDKTQFSRRRGRRRGLTVLLVVAALLGGGILYGQGLLAPTVDARLASVSLLYPAQTFTLLNASGYVVAQRKAAVGSKLTSRLIYLGAAEGQQVREGQIIARLENADLLAARDRARANIAVARAAVAEAEAELREADLSFQRTREMLNRKFMSSADFDTAEARYKTAQAMLATRRASLEVSLASLAEAEVQVDYASIRAPFDGVVLTKNADVGDIITPLGAASNARASVVTMADMNSYQVEADVAESNITQVRVGQPCEIQLDALPDVRLRGQVQTIVPTADRSKASIMVKVAFAERDPRILPEMSARVAFLAREVGSDEQQPVVAVPKQALVEQDGQPLVYVARNGQAVATPVTLGRRFKDLTEVTAGLQAGDQVVLQPGESVRNGVKLRPLEG